MIKLDDLNDFEIEVLKVFKEYKGVHISRDHLHGYFHFCNMDDLLYALYDLKEKELIMQGEAMPQYYYIHPNGEKALLKLNRLTKEEKDKKWDKVERWIIPIIVAIVSYLLGKI